MTEKLLPVIIFVTIYSKSSYSFPDRDGRQLLSQVSENSSVSRVNLLNNINKLYESVKSLTESSVGKENDSKSRDEIVKLFVNRGNSENNNREVVFEGRSYKSPSLWRSFVDMVSGGFTSKFGGVLGKKTPKRAKKKKQKRPANNYQSEEFDPLGSFLDGLDNFFNGPDNDDASNELDNFETGPEDFDTIYTVYDQTTQPVATEITVVEEPIFGSTSEGQLGYYVEDVHKQNQIDNKNNRSNTTIKVNKKNMKPVTLLTSTIITTTRRKTTPMTTKKTTTTPKTTTTTSTTTTTTTTTTLRPTTKAKSKTTTTAKPLIIPTRKIYKLPIKYTNPIYEKVTRKPTRRPENHAQKDRLYQMIGSVNQQRPTDVLKQSQLNPDCVSGKPTQSWFSNMWGADENELESSHTTTKAPGGWLSFLQDDDDEVQQVDAPAAGSWFSNMFSDDDPPIQVPITTTTTTTPAPSWFNTFLNAEEDDGAYAQNLTETSNGKKGLRKTYKGFQLLRIYPKTKSKVRVLKDLEEETQGSGLMWWSMPSLNRPADLLVPPSLMNDIKDHLSSSDIHFDVIIWDLQKAIAFENPRLSKTQRLELERSRGHPLTWRRYHRYADILRYLEYMSLKYPNLVDLVPLGRSSEGMPIVAAKISTPSNTSVPVNARNHKKWRLRSRMKPAVWIDAGMHAREWIAPAVATWILHALVEGEKGRGADMDMINLADWYILPVANPDGYEHTHTMDRLWRKTRSRLAGQDNYFNSWFPWNWGNTDCVGVDPNRNWDHHWSEKGASNDPCSDYFAGPYPFSEPETKVVSNFLMENKDQIKVYLTLQSYSQMLLVPTTHSKSSFTDSSELMEMGKLAVSALSDVSGTKYSIGTMSELLQPVTGTAHDWAKGRAGIKYSYAVKMRDSNGPNGFLLPGSQIIPTAKETWEAIKVMADNL